MAKIGVRNTRQRQIIIDALKKFSKPVSAQELFDSLKKTRESVDLASIYRTLTLMKECGFVNIILFGEGKKRYELSGDNHHHHFVCEKCGHIEDVEVDEKKLLKSLKSNSDFLIKKHNLEFFGLCPKCK